MAVADGTKPDYRQVPAKAIPREQVPEVFPTIRQSLLSSFDDCELGTWFQLRHENGWSTHPQARGTLFHRVAARCLETMREQDSEGIPVQEALQILEEVAYQHDVDPRDIVRVRAREFADLEMAVIKFAHDNTFSTRNIVAVEKRLNAELRYAGPDGEEIVRVLTGQLDALIARGADEAVVLDWKTTWALPPARDENADDPGVSYHGYFQQLFYAWLVMQNYPSIQAVTLREFYVYRTKARGARVTRDQLPMVESRLRQLVSNFDRAIAAGAPPKLTLKRLERHGSWKPSPGAHCQWCRKAHLCPIDTDYRVAGITTPEKAAEVAALREVAGAVYKQATEKLKPWVELNGPVPLKYAKGRRVLGFRKIKGGVRFEAFTPTDADRPPTEVAFSPNLADAMRESTARAKAARDEEAEAAAVGQKLNSEEGSDAR